MTPWRRTSSRQARLGLLHAVVDVERRLVDVGADVEGHLDLTRAVRRRGRGHVEHALDAVDRVLDRRGDGLLDDLRRGARIEAVTVTTGGAISGYCAIGRFRIAARPAMTIKTERTAAKIGRSMKNLENMARAYLA